MLLANYFWLDEVYLNSITSILTQSFQHLHSDYRISGNML